MNRVSTTNLASACGCLALTALLSLSAPTVRDAVQEQAVKPCAQELSQRDSPLAYVPMRVERDPTLNPIMSCDLISSDFRYDQRHIYRAPQAPKPAYVNSFAWRDPMLNPLYLLGSVDIQPSDA